MCPEVEELETEDANEICDFRMRLLLLVQISMRRHLNLFPRVAGLYQAIRYEAHAPMVLQSVSSK